jgi:hypothetical protein
MNSQSVPTEAAAEFTEAAVNRMQLGEVPPALPISAAADDPGGKGIKKEKLPKPAKSAEQLAEDLRKKAVDLRKKRITNITSLMARHVADSKTANSRVKVLTPKEPRASVATESEAAADEPETLR